MAAEKVGRVKAGKSGKSYEVKWDASTRDVYVGYAGWTHTQERHPGPERLCAEQKLICMINKSNLVKYHSLVKRKIFYFGQMRQATGL